MSKIAHVPASTIATTEIASTVAEISNAPVEARNTAAQDVIKDAGRVHVGGGMMRF